MYDLTRLDLLGISISFLHMLYVYVYIHMLLYMYVFYVLYMYVCVNMQYDVLNVCIYVYGLTAML